VAASGDAASDGVVPAVTGGAAASTSTGGGSSVSPGQLPPAAGRQQSAAAAASQPAKQRSGLPAQGTSISGARALTLQVCPPRSVSLDARGPPTASALLYVRASALQACLPAFRSSVRVSTGTPSTCFGYLCHTTAHQQWARCTSTHVTPYVRVLDCLIHPLCVRRPLDLVLEEWALAS
jgi:hypothetical protein